jgi:hypothetical protein
MKPIKELTPVNKRDILKVGKGKTFLTSFKN